MTLAEVLPPLNACLNGLSALLLVCGFIAIRAKKIHLHRAFMIAAFTSSTLFLISYLTRFDFSTIKIDRTFVRALESDDRSRRLAESICAIGKSLGLALVAEGVETEVQAAAMTSFGVDYMQGYLFGEPVKAEGFR